MTTTWKQLVSGVVAAGGVHQKNDSRELLGRSGQFVKREKGNSRVFIQNSLGGRSVKNYVTIQEAAEYLGI